MEKQILRRCAAQDDRPKENPSSLTPEQFRRMLEETLAADPGLARRVLWPLAGTVFPFVGGNPGTPGTIVKFDSSGNPTADSVIKESSSNLGIGTTNAGTFTQLNGETGRPGLLRVSTGPTIGTNATLYWSSISTTPVSGIFLPGDFFDIVFSMRVYTNDGFTQVRVGGGSNVTTNPPGYGIYFEKLAGDTNWFCVTRSSGVETRTNSGVAVTTNWVRLRIRRIDSSTIGFSLDGAPEIQQTTNIPTVGLQAFASVRNSVGIAKVIDIDYFTFSITGLRR